jgi:hypothetical protein
MSSGLMIMKTKLCETYPLVNNNDIKVCTVKHVFWFNDNDNKEFTVKHVLWFNDNDKKVV